MHILNNLSMELVHVSLVFPAVKLVLFDRNLSARVQNSCAAKYLIVSPSVKLSNLRICACSGLETLLRISKAI